MTNSALLTQHILYINHHQTKSHRVNIMVFKFQFTHNLIHNVLSQCLVEHDADLPAGIEERLTWRESSLSFFCSNLLPPNGSRRVFITVVSMNEDKLFAVVNNKTFVMVKNIWLKISLHFSLCPPLSQVHDECDVGRQRPVLHRRRVPGEPKAGGYCSQQGERMGEGRSEDFCGLRFNSRPVPDLTFHLWWHKRPGPHLQLILGADPDLMVSDSDWRRMDWSCWDLTGEIWVRAEKGLRPSPFVSVQGVLHRSFVTVSTFSLVSSAVTSTIIMSSFTRSVDLLWGFTFSHLHHFKPQYNTQYSSAPLTLSLFSPSSPL